MQSVAVSGSVCRSQIFRLCANEVAYCCHQLLAAYTCHIIGGLDAFRFISLRCRSAGIFCRDFTVLRVVLRAASVSGSVVSTAITSSLSCEAAFAILLTLV